MNVTVDVAQMNGCAVVGLRGELDLGSADEVHTALTAVIDDMPNPLVLDLSELRFCDSAGLAVLVRAHQRLAARGRKLVVARPTPIVARVLDLSGLDQLIVTAGDPEDACTIALTS
jgi:anti-anti-sigma factor